MAQLRAFANGDHGAATHSLREQCSQSGSERMTVTVCPQLSAPERAGRRRPAASRLHLRLCWISAITTIDPFRLA